MRRRLDPDQNNFTPHSDIFDSIFFASRETKFEMYKRILVAARIAPPLKVGAARPPHSSALSTLWWRMAPKRVRYSRHRALDSDSASASQMVSGGDPNPFARRSLPGHRRTAV